MHSDTNMKQMEYVKLGDNPSVANMGNVKTLNAKNLMFRNNSQECTAGISKSQIDKDPKKIYVLLWEGFQRSQWFCFPDSILFSIVH